MNKSYRFTIIFSSFICNVLNKNQLLHQWMGEFKIIWSNIRLTIPVLLISSNFPISLLCVQLTIYSKARPISCLLRYLNSVDLINILLITLIFSFKYSAEFFSGLIFQNNLFLGTKFKANWFSELLCYLYSNTYKGGGLNKSTTWVIVIQLIVFTIYCWVKTINKLGR